jgi:prepilin-type processing-associated H-X9-DG protein
MDLTYQGILSIDRGEQRPGRRLTDVTDGTSNTLLLVESAGRDRWLLKGGQQAIHPTNGPLNVPPRDGFVTGPWASGSSNFARGVQGCDPSTIITSGNSAGTYSVPGPCAINCMNFQQVYAFHSGGANVVFGDGSVHFLQESMPVYVLAALFTRDTGEVIPGGHW